MKIKNLLCLALMPLFAFGIVLSYRFKLKKPAKPHSKRKKRKKCVLSETDIEVLQLLEHIHFHYYKNGVLETTANDFHTSIIQEFAELEITPSQIGLSFSRLHQHYPNMIYKKKVKGKEVRRNKGYLWVYSSQNEK